MNRASAINLITCVTSCDEAGTYSKEVLIQNADAIQTNLTMPEDAAGKTIHVILTVRDSGQSSLTRYRRIALSCLE